MEEKIETLQGVPVAPVEPVKKRLGRPPGVKNKTKKVRKVSQTPIEKLQRAHDKLKDEHLLHQRTSNTACNALNNIIADLKHEIIGYQAVISYLENQLGLKKSI